MIFNSLRINNYRAYYGESIFDFPIEGEQIISILYADNDVGKSCFFQQFYSAYMVLKTVMISRSHQCKCAIGEILSY